MIDNIVTFILRITLSIFVLFLAIILHGDHENLTFITNNEEDQDYNSFPQSDMN